MRTVCEPARHLRALIVSLTQSQSRDIDTVVHADHQNTFTPKQTPQSEPTDHDLLRNCLANDGQLVAIRR